MKILIISTGRAGSSSLLYGLGKSLNKSITYYEPFNGYNLNPILSKSQYLEHKSEIYNSTSSNLISKSLIYQPPSTTHEKSITLPLDKLDEFYKNFYINYASVFDRVILLCRKDVVKTAESYAYAYDTLKWHEKYKLNSKNLNIQKELAKVKMYNQVIQNLSSHINVPLSYYEDLFNGNQEYIKNWLIQNKILLDNPQELYNKLNPIYKYRQD